MHYTEYAKRAMAHRNADLSEDLQLVNAALKITGEFAEFDSANSNKNKILELGDIFWYTTLLRFTFNWEHSDPNESNELILKHSNINDIRPRFRNFSDAMAEYTAKLVCQGHKLDEEKGPHLMSSIKIANERITELLFVLARNVCNTNMSTVMQLNIDKLDARHEGKTFNMRKNARRTV